MKSEVKALEYAVCALVAKLDMLLTCEIGLSGLLDARYGLHISTPEHLKGVGDAFVTIRPTGWSDGASITARFFRANSDWMLYEGGVIENPDLPLGINRLRFKPSQDPIGVRLEPTGHWQTSFAKAGYSWLIDALKKDVDKF